ncbi:hypothetical protein E2C01_035498 [Portunus trituberculatus]|uniref:Uncharacterized protein n=1 Tax=Portunus trituberculatus TaxID=210409 RepID=A0A5B7F3C0_PORTR|nr:hypothetical protein [Portunus trituberculatus]
MDHGKHDINPQLMMIVYGIHSIPKSGWFSCERGTLPEHSWKLSHYHASSFEDETGAKDQPKLIHNSDKVRNFWYPCMYYTVCTKSSDAAGKKKKK